MLLLTKAFSDTIYHQQHFIGHTPSLTMVLAHCANLHLELSSMDTKERENAATMDSHVDQGLVSTLTDRSVSNMQCEEPSVTWIEM
jgi:hypothetical protein